MSSKRNSDVGRFVYIWLDGSEPVQKLRSKVRICKRFIDKAPDWSFDGSSTNQSETEDSDLILKNVRQYASGDDSNRTVYVICEVMNPDGTPHETNTRSLLGITCDQINSDFSNAAKHCWFGFEQEYTMMTPDGEPLGFRTQRNLGLQRKGQGQYYCAVGRDNIFGEVIANEHMEKCLEYGILYSGLNAEVMPGQWEYQIGVRAKMEKDDSPDPLEIADDSILARYLLHEVAQSHNVIISFDPKPVEGDWNGAGMHTNFSNREIRGEVNRVSGKDYVIEEVIPRMGKNHSCHIEVYGHGNDRRLTGNHETCDIKTFKAGAADRGASIRIPRAVMNEGKGYIEDRRPAANADPYLVAQTIMNTVYNTVIDNEPLISFFHVR